MFLSDEYISTPDLGLPIGNSWGGIVGLEKIADSLPEWLQNLEDKEEFLTPGSIKQADEEDIPDFIRDLPSDAFTDDATMKVVKYNPNGNPTKVVDREYLMSDKSDLINDSADMLKQVLKSLAPTIFSQQPNLSKIEVGNVNEDGHVEDGRVVWNVEISASNQPGIYRTQQSTPLRRSRVEIPMVVKNGSLVHPMVMTNSSNKLYPLTVEGCQLLLDWKQQPVIKKSPPKVERSWAEERDYRAF